MSYLNLSAQLEAIIYLAKEPIAIDAIHKALPEVDREALERAIQLLIEKYQMENHGIEIREVAGGLRFSTKPEHHEVLRKFLQSQNPPTRLSLAALETLAVIAYKQPATGPEIMEIRGVQGGGVFKTLLDRKLIAVAGRKNVIGKPILYKTTKEFLIQFGLKDLSELPSLKEFEEIRRMAFADSEPPAPEAAVDGSAPEAAEPVAQEALEAPETYHEPIAEAPAGEAAAVTSEPPPEEPAAAPQVKEEE